MAVGTMLRGVLPHGWASRHRCMPSSCRVSDMTLATLTVMSMWKACSRNEGVLGNIRDKCLLNKPYWRSNVKKSLFCTLYGVLKLVIFNSYMSYKCRILIQNAELLTPVAQNWHIFFRSYEEMTENRRKQQKSMSLSLTSETAVEYTIWLANDTYIITVCWVMKNREKQMISTS